MNDVEKLIEALHIQYEADIPEMPQDWTGEEQWDTFMAGKTQ